MTNADFRAIEPRLDGLLRQVGAYPPVDLAAVARSRKIYQLELRSMLLDGALQPVEGGFKVYIYDPASEGEFPLTIAENLSHRQRFTLAHEIGHTFFFDAREKTPIPAKDIPSYPALERLCDLIASEILLPGPLLKQYIAKWEPLSIETAAEIARLFRVSLEAVLRRFSRSPDLVSPMRAVLLLNGYGREDVAIVTSYFGSGLLPFLPRPKRGPLKNWNRELASWCRESSAENFEEVIPGLSARFKVVSPGRRRYLLELAPTRDL